MDVKNNYPTDFKNVDNYIGITDEVKLMVNKQKLYKIKGIAMKEKNE